MARSKKLSSIYYDGFEGMDTQKCHSGKESSAYIENFRIKSDGSLEKRYGYKHLTSFGIETIKEVWCGEIEGKKKCFVSTDTMKIYSLNMETGEAVQIGSFPESPQPAAFFFYQGSLYFKNARTNYLITDTGITNMPGYVPLIGKNWGTSRPGELYQPINIMHKKIRISYKIPESHTAMLPTLYPISSVLALYKNGELMDSSKYFIDERFNTINVTEITEGDEFSALLDMKSYNPNTDMFRVSKKATVYGEINDAAIYLLGSPRKNIIPVSRLVSTEDVEECNAIAPNHGNVYFPLDDMLTVGDGAYKSTAVAKIYDKLIIFNKKEAWMADSTNRNGEKVPSVNISHDEGCNIFNACAVVNDVPYTVSNNAVLKWSIDTNDPNKSKIESISNEISEHLSPEFFENAMLYYYSAKNELWLYNKDVGNTAYIYNLDNKSWVAISNISPYIFFEYDDDICFHDKHNVYRFCKELDEDTTSDGIIHSITARFESGILSFGSTDKKRLSTGKIIGDLMGGNLNMELTCDSGETISLPLDTSEEHSVIVKRLNSGRFRNLKFSFSCNGKAGMTIHSLKLTTRSKE